MESWKVDYYYRRGEDKLIHDIRTIVLPDGYYKKSLDFLHRDGSGRLCKLPDTEQDPGVIYKLERWGVGLWCLEFGVSETHFDLPQGTPRRGQSSTFTLGRLLDGMRVIAKGRALADTFIIGSEEHPFRIYAPNGSIMGTYITLADFKTKSQDAAERKRTKRNIEALNRKFEREKIAELVAK